MKFSFLFEGDADRRRKERDPFKGPADRASIARDIIRKEGLSVNQAKALAALDYREFRDLYPNMFDINPSVRYGLALSYGVDKRSALGLCVDLIKRTGKIVYENADCDQPVCFEANAIISRLDPAKLNFDTASMIEFRQGFIENILDPNNHASSSRHVTSLLSLLRMVAFCVDINDKTSTSGTRMGIMLSELGNYLGEDVVTQAVVDRVLNRPDISKIR